MKLAEILDRLKNNTLKGLDLATLEQDNGLPANDATLATLADPLKTNHSLMLVRIYGEHVTDQGIKQLTDALAGRNNVEWLIIEKTHLGKQGFKAITGFLSKNPVTHLSIKNTTFETNLLEDFFSGLARWENLSYLNMSNCGINDEDLSAVYEDMADPRGGYYPNFHLTYLDLNNNNLSTAAIKRLADGILQNNVITYLTVENNPGFQAAGQSILTIQNRIALNRQLRERFLNLRTDFELIREFDRTYSSNGAKQYRCKAPNHEDNDTQWVIKTNAGASGPINRIKALQEAYAGQLMRSIVAHFPITKLVRIGGSFQVASKYIDGFTHEFPAKEKPLIGVVESWIAALWLADFDSYKKENRGFQHVAIFLIHEDVIFFYKLDLGEAFDFDAYGKKLSANDFLADNIRIKFLLPNNATVREVLLVDNIVSELKKFPIAAKKSLEEDSIYTEMLDPEFLAETRKYLSTRIEEIAKIKTELEENINHEADQQLSAPSQHH